MFLYRNKDPSVKHPAKEAAIRDRVGCLNNLIFRHYKVSLAHDVVVSVTLNNCLHTFRPREVKRKPDDSSPVISLRRIRAGMLRMSTSGNLPAKSASDFIIALLSLCVSWISLASAIFSST
jgi:hypothetical protein